jgi:hemerythrin
MPYLEWDARYSVQNEFIDSQHKNILKAINSLIDAIDEGKTGVFCSKLHSALKAYTERHFSHEEKVLEKYNYPELSRQRKEHQYFIRKLEEIYEQMENDEEDIEVELQMLDFLKEWFYNHILKSDFDYVDTLQQNVG